MKIFGIILALAGLILIIYPFGEKYENIKNNGLTKHYAKAIYNRYEYIESEEGILPILTAYGCKISYEEKHRYINGALLQLIGLIVVLSSKKSIFNKQVENTP